MNDLIPLAETIAARLKARRDSIAIAESSTGGLISAALPGASAYFLGGAVAYTRRAKILQLGLDETALTQFRPATEPHALLLARRAQARFAATWGLGETGATGSTGNRYGDPAGHTCLAVAGAVERTITVGSAERLANMRAFAAAALKLLVSASAISPDASIICGTAISKIGTMLADIKQSRSAISILILILQSVQMVLGSGKGQGPVYKNFLPIIL